MSSYLTFSAPRIHWGALAGWIGAWKFMYPDVLIVLIHQGPWRRQYSATGSNTSINAINRDLESLGALDD